MGFPSGSVVKHPRANEGDAEDADSTRGSSIHFPRDLPNVWVEPGSLVLQADSLLSDSLEKRVTTHSRLFA